MLNRNVVSTTFWPGIVSNLSVVSILLLNGKSNRCFNNFLALHCRQSICCFNSIVIRRISSVFQHFFGLRLQAIYPLFQFVSQMGNRTVASTTFWTCIVRNLSVVSILFSNGKCIRCFNSFLALHFRPSNRCFKFFVKWKI